MQSDNNCLLQHPRKRTCSFSNRSKMASDRASRISIFSFLFVIMYESHTRYSCLAIFTHTSSFSVENYLCSKWCYRVTGFLYTVDYRRLFKSSLVAYMLRKGWIQERNCSQKNDHYILWKCLLHSLFKAAAMLAHQAQMGKMILCVLEAKSGTCFIRGRWDLTDSECLPGCVRIIWSRRSIYTSYLCDYRHLVTYT